MKNIYGEKYHPLFSILFYPLLSQNIFTKKKTHRAKENKQLIPSSNEDRCEYYMDTIYIYIYRHPLCLWENIDVWETFNTEVPSLALAGGSLGYEG